MMFIKIIVGLIGLGVVVFVHELGHFIAARLAGIDVEAFSIGWGKPILKKRIGRVEYRLGIFPIGGYCKMRGENELQEAFDNKKENIPPAEGAFYGASPWRRILVSFAGPFFNLVFAIMVFSFIWGIGFEVYTMDNRIVLASDIDQEWYPANEAGLKTGDRIIEIDRRPIANYHDIQEVIATNAEKNLTLKVEREGKILDLAIRPSLEKSSGAGKIGVYYWADPVISAVAEGSPAAVAGLRRGDRIKRVNGEEFPYTVAMLRILPEQVPVLFLEYERDGEIKNTNLVISYTREGNADIGITYESIHYHTPSYSPWGAVLKGAEETWKTLVVSVKSFGLLFRGIDLTQAVSGPVRITYMVGEIAAEGFDQSIGTGISSMANFLALISIALCIMNLLPLPILDGGMIVLFIIEVIKGRPLRPQTVYAFQTIGAVLIFGIMIFAVFGDILFLVRR
ncbi:MAG: site-2 protease family protein [Spirochaetaceae bacterium]|jgi:regulator of sigma E protease|nr:site-2 protease family protein [Spirochaetaceae bacterium]